MNDSSPSACGRLDGVRVLITRPKGQASGLRDCLEKLGAITVPLPLIEIAPPASFAALDDALLSLETFDWIVLTSANAVDALGRRLLKLVMEAPGQQRTPIKRLAVIGASTQIRVREVSQLMPQIAPLLPPSLVEVLVPPRAVAESLAEALEGRIPQLLREQGRVRVLLPRAEQARDVLPERLRAAGAELTIATAYRNRIPADSVPLLREIFSNPERWPDIIPFTSSSGVTNLFTLLEAAGLALPPGITRVSIGSVTSATMREHGFGPDAEAAESTIVSLCDAIVATRQTHRVTAR